MMTVGCYFSDDLQRKNWEVFVTAKLTFVNVWTNFVSGTLIVIMSVDRCLCVAMPLKSAKLLTYRPMVAAIALTWVAELACYLPLFLVFSVKWRVDPTTNRTVAYRAVSDWFTTDTTMVFNIPNYISLIVMPLSLVVVVVCCTITILHLRRASRHRRKMVASAKEGEGDSEVNRITRMLLVLCVVYVICILPRVCVDLTYNILPGFFHYQKYHNSFIVFNKAVQHGHTGY
ncbi:hypothetical protein ACOMHN_015681 [Nucella lapillus]